MFLTLYLVMLVMWMLGLLALPVTGPIIHLLLAAAVIALIAHYVRIPQAKD